MKVQQIYAITYRNLCVRLGKAQTENFKIIKKACVDTSLLQREWHKWRELTQKLQKLST